MKRNTISPSRFIKMKRAFYVRPTLTVARDLLGLYLFRRIGHETLIGRIVEVEAYRGGDDPASHAYRGRTKRNEVMFRTGGYLYVYFSYGMHFCCNVVTEEERTPGAVLIRAIEPAGSIDTLVKNRIQGRRSRISARPARHAPKPLNLHQLCSGPARVCKAFAIDRKDNGKDLCGYEIWLAKEALSGRDFKLTTTTRIGVTSGTHHRWRFHIAGNPAVSRARPVGSL